VTAAKILAEAALSAGKFIQAFPEFGPERAGAPVRSFNRISDNSIKSHSQITNPDVVVVLDATLLGTINVCEGLKDGGLVIINTSKTPTEIKKANNIKAKVATVDATDIAVREFKRNIPNTPMIAALVKTTDILPLDVVLKGFKEQFSGKFSPEVVEANLRAMKEAFDKVKVE